MRVQVLFFAQAARVIGQDSEKLELPDGSTVGEAVAHIVRRYPRLIEFEDALQFAVNDELALRARPLESGETLAILPPFTGG